ncbi:hypothetical protein ACIQXD_05270 [Streptomyces uncialis]|uniref:hypothetical protein n=1 Tax=Streptomyces uncialis TaxID=1048205 RepID=UPI00380188B9
MNTSAAAVETQVSVSTVRTWCRIGAVAATKAAGRWIIEAGSLARRIAIGTRRAACRAARRAAQVVYSVETMTAIGGNRWQKNGMDRVYLNHTDEYLPIEVERYNTGNIRWAAWNGERISNAQASNLLCTVEKVWFDTATGKLHGRYSGVTSRIAGRDEVWQHIVTGIRADIAAL